MATRPQNALQDFISYVKTVGMPTGSRFRVNVTADNRQDVMLLASNVSIPGISIMTAENRVFGESLFTPYGVNYAAASITFMLDNVMLAKTYFDNWTNAVYDRETRTVGYYNEYKRDIQIQLLDKADSVIYDVTLVDAYPVETNDVGLDLSSNDIISLSVSIRYKFWAVNYDPSGSVTLDQISRDVASAPPDTGASSPQDSGMMGPPIPFSGDSGTPSDIADFGGMCSRSMGISAGQVSKIASSAPMSGASSFSSNFSDLSNNFTSFGSSITSLGRSLTAVTAPVGQMAGSINAITGTLGTLDSTLSALGLGRPFAKVRTDLNGTAAKLGAVGGLKGVPGNLTSLGVNFSSMGSTFTQLSKSLDTVPGATSKLKTAVNNLGLNVSRTGDNLGNSAPAIDRYADDNAIS